MRRFATLIRSATMPSFAWWKTPTTCWPLSGSTNTRASTTYWAGAISPLDGVGPEDLRIRELLQRIDPAQAACAPTQNGQTPANDEAAEVAKPPREIIFALNPTVEGDTTVYYLSQLLKSSGIRLTRIARGLPIGGDLEYADEATLARALEGRDAL